MTGSLVSITARALSSVLLHTYLTSTSASNSLHIFQPCVGPSCIWKQRLQRRFRCRWSGERQSHITGRPRDGYTSSPDDTRRLHVSRLPTCRLEVVVAQRHKVVPGLHERLASTHSCTCKPGQDENALQQRSIGICKRPCSNQGNSDLTKSRRTDRM